jgi:outer membrane biosynthesis protein TonB
MSTAASERYPAMAASAALHAAVLLAGIIAWPWLNKPLHMSSVVPITLVTSQDVSNLRPAIAAPTPAPAATEAPTPDASPQAPAPQETPQPTPTPAKPSPPQPKPSPAKPAPPKPAVAKQSAPSFDPDAVLASLTKTKPSGPRQSSAARGPTRPETAVQARTAVGAGDAISANALSALAGELQRLWNPNCDVEGGSDANIKVSFRLGPSGRLIAPPESSQENATDPIVKAASDRAKRAVNQGAPFDDLPPALYGQKILVNFNAKQACAQR